MEHVIVAIIVLFWFYLGWRAHSWADKHIHVWAGRYADAPEYRAAYVAVKLFGKWRRLGIAFRSGDCK